MSSSFNCPLVPATHYEYLQKTAKDVPELVDCKRIGPTRLVYEVVFARRPGGRCTYEGYTHTIIISPVLSVFYEAIILSNVLKALSLDIGAAVNRASCS